jgi:predicted HNH restriction endonuclease
MAWGMAGVCKSASNDMEGCIWIYYGCRCYACGLASQPHLIQVHHLDPIAEGERRTKIEDVIPLCLNCHAQSHTQKPPIPIAELKVWATNNLTPMS